MNQEIITQTAIYAIEMQSNSIKGLAAFIDDSFIKAVTSIAQTKGRLVVSGIGKSAIIAQKIVATLNSTGTPALFMHAADAIHGDLGMIQQEDVVMVISKSGDSPEIKVLIPLLKGFGNIIIGMGGNVHSFLASNCNIYLNTTVEQEVCPNNLAPTTSTTAQMVMGDALAVCLMNLKGFEAKDFAKFHPGGALGKKLYLRVSDLLTNHHQPSVLLNTPVKDVIIEITKNRLGATVVLNTQNEIAGIVTDGDIRRMLENSMDFNALLAKDIMSSNPKLIESEALAAEAFDKMRQYNVNQLLVVNQGRYIGIVHIQELLKEGII